MASIGYRAEVDAARRFVEEIEPDDIIVLLFSADVDGCCSAAIMTRTLRQLGNELVYPVFLEKGETLYSERVAKRVLVREPSKLIVMDMGGSGKPIVPGLTTMVIDDHRPEGIPPVDLFVSSYGSSPPAPSCLLVYSICKEFTLLDGSGWLSAIGIAADAGISANFESLQSAIDQYGEAVISDAVKLLSSAMQCESFDVPAAFDALMEADSPIELASLAIPEASVLANYRAEVDAELQRIMSITPRVAGSRAVVQFSSPAMVHSPAADLWAERMPDKTIIAANYGCIPGNVCFGIRTLRGADAISMVEKIPSGSREYDFNHWKSEVSGAVLPEADFKAFLAGIGFPMEVWNSEPDDLDAG